MGWTLALAALVAGCGMPSLNPCTGNPETDLLHDDPKCRIQAAVIAVELDRVDLVPRLIENLRDPNGDVRMLTGVAIRKLTGVDAGFRSFATAAEQEAAIEKWQHWWAEREHSGRRGLPGSKLEEMSKR